MAPPRTAHLRLSDRVAVAKARECMILQGGAFYQDYRTRLWHWTHGIVARSKGFSKRAEAARDFLKTRETQ